MLGREPAPQIHGCVDQGFQDASGTICVVLNLLIKGIAHMLMENSEHITNNITICKYIILCAKQIKTLVIVFGDNLEQARFCFILYPFAVGDVTKLHSLAAKARSWDLLILIQY